jgi:hypothetical protein
MATQAIPPPPRCGFSPKTGGFGQPFFLSSRSHPGMATCCCSAQKSSFRGTKPDLKFPAFQNDFCTYVPIGNICFTIYYLHKVYFSCQNSTFGDGKVWPGSRSRWICFGLAPWIRIGIRIHIEVKSWTRTRIETNADPKH